METKHGIQGTHHQGVFFTEADVPGSESLGRIQVEIGRQNANLKLVKDQMAQEASRRGAKTIANFRYGQRPHKWWQLVTFKWDTESWFGEGDALR
jgi:hypothetical protein